jgi:peptidoglycan/LPS O-acetylase OafA/YrhL
MTNGRSDRYIGATIDLSPSGDEHVTTIVILVIAVLAPWVVHLAPPRQRPLALVCAVGVLLIVGIFIANPLGTWEFWLGLVIGIGSVVVVSRRGTQSGIGRSTRRRRDADRYDEDDETLHGE